MKNPARLIRHRSPLPFRVLVVVCPLLMAGSLFLGHDWQHPLHLLAPEQHGLLALRAWRVLLGAVVGASLAAAGTILQAVLRNPLAEPYVLGVSAGAGVGAASCIAFGGLALGAAALPLSGFAGGLVSLTVVYLLARVELRTSPHTLILAGVVWGSLCSSILMFFVSQSSAEGLHAVSWWFLGDLQVYDVQHIKAVALLNGTALLAVALLFRPLNVLTLGDEMAEHLGLPAERTKRLLLALATLLAAASVSVSGLIAFVGLVVPHVTRSLVGPDHRRLLPGSALLGAAFLTVTDGLGRLILYPQEIPVGIFTALVGAPFFLFLLRKRPGEVWS
jgi:iron complex transport system permease protein